MKRIRWILAIIAAVSLIASVCYAEGVCLTGSGGCHEMTGDPPEVVVIRDCLASGCHDTRDHGNHHTTDVALAGMCNVCHPANLVDNYDDENPKSSPVSSVTPTVQSCANCHKGHANPLDGQQPNPVPYPYPIYETEILEHQEMGSLLCSEACHCPAPGGDPTDYDCQTCHNKEWPSYIGNCLLCHGNEQAHDASSIDTTDPYAIRYCETCHSVATLHLIPGHAVICPDPPDPCDPPLPYDGFWYDEYGTWSLIAYGVYSNERCLACHLPPDLEMSYVSQDVGTYDTAFSEIEVGVGPDDDSQTCRKCHGANTSDRHHYLGGVIPCSVLPDDPDPVIDTNACSGMSAIVGTRMAHVELRGSNFGEKPGQLPICGVYEVQMEQPVDSGTWLPVPTPIWTDTLVEGVLPAYLFSPYEYHKVRVENPAGTSNERTFYVLPAPAVDRIEDNTGKDAQGPVGGWLTVYSVVDGNQGTFNDARQKWYEDSLGGTCPDFYGAIYVVTLTSSSNDRLSVKTYIEWNASGNKDSFKVRLWNLWEDLDGDYYQDGNEPGGAPLYLGPYSVQVCLIIYGDSSGDGGFSGDEDTIYQVVKSKSEIIYDVRADPLIVKLDPNQIQGGQLLKILGGNFGPDQGDGEVRVGGTTVASDPNLGLGYNLQTVGGGGPRPINWKETLIRLYMPTNTVYYDNRIVCVWVEKNGAKSNYKKIQLLEP